jgi:hypothetical protein
VLALQVHAPARLAGAIPQDVQRGRVTHKYFPYYVARCVPALLLAYEHTRRQRTLDGAVAAMRFVARCLDSDGLLPQVVYPRGANRYPQWLAPLGDVLRAAGLLASHGVHLTFPTLEAALLRAQIPGGGSATARGFAAQVTQKRCAGAPPGFRDGVAVAGWADKAFRYLAGRVPEGEPLPPSEPIATFSAPCTVGGRRALWLETETEMQLLAAGRTLYHWRKGQPWAAVARRDVLWK